MSAPVDVLMEAVSNLADPLTFILSVNSSPPLSVPVAPPLPLLLTERHGHILRVPASYLGVPSGTLDDSSPVRAEILHI